MTDNSNHVDYRFLGNVHAVVRPLWCHRTIKNIHRFILQNFHMSDKKTHRFHGIFKDDCDLKCLRIGDIKQATFTDERLKAHGANVTMGTTLLDRGRTATRTRVSNLFQYPFPHCRVTHNTPHHELAKLKLSSTEDGTGIGESEKKP